MGNSELSSLLESRCACTARRYSAIDFAIFATYVLFVSARCSANFSSPDLFLGGQI